MDNELITLPMMPAEDCPFAAKGQHCKILCDMCTLRHECLYCAVKDLQSPNSNIVPKILGHQIWFDLQVMPYNNALADDLVFSSEYTFEEDLELTGDVGDNTNFGQDASPPESDVYESDSFGVTDREKAQYLVQSAGPDGDDKESESYYESEEREGTNPPQPQTKNSLYEFDTEEEGDRTRPEAQNAECNDWVEHYSCPQCRRPDHVEVMVACEGCNNWFHFSCGKLHAAPLEEDEWICPDCVAKKSSQPKQSTDNRKIRTSKKPSSGQKQVKKDWTDPEKASVISLMEEVIEEEKYHQSEEKWEIISQRLLKKYNISRSGGSVKNVWSRTLRAETGIDERINKNPDKMRTSVETSAQRRRKRKITKEAADHGGGLLPSSSKRQRGTPRGT